MTDVIITAPVQGWSAPLEEVPDPVFAQGMMGDGVAIHPMGAAIFAPCDGTIATLHAAGHALTIRHASGAEILVHIGLDTVALGGRGFRPQVAEGAAVARGEPLIEFDLDAVARAARSLVTPVIVVNSDAFRIESRTVGKVVEAGDALFTLTPIEAAQRDAANGVSNTCDRTIVIPLAHGIHARPAARVAECARRFEAHVEIVHAGRRANARSAVSIMGLGLKHGDSATIEARGSDAPMAVAAVGDLILDGMDEPDRTATPPMQKISPAGVAVPAGALAGVTAAPGIAIGPAHRLAASIAEVTRDADDPQAESAALDAARSTVRTRIAAAAEGGSEAQQGIMSAHLAFLDDEDLLALARAQMASGRSAGFAWRAAISRQVAALRQADDPRFAERVSDLVDIERQVLLALAGADLSGEHIARGAILLAEDLLPSQLIGFERGAVAGIVLAGGGATSHVAIIAGSIGLPMLVATGAPLAKVADGTMLALDADGGLVHVDPSEDLLESHRERIAKKGERKAAALASALEVCRTADGTRIELFANLGSVDDAAAAVSCGAEGSGLVRTEFLFLGRRDAPSEAEQLASYQAIATAMAGRPVIVRLLDIGGDKPAPYLPLAPESNPMLGQRGIRATLAHPDLLDAQLRAILRVQPSGQCRIMVPMVTGVGELRAVREAATRAGERVSISTPVQIGAMIETPAAAATADLIAAEADFLSIGTNDLTQYTLAMDRENAAVAADVDALHPAVLRLIGQACEGAARHGRPVGVCGGLASDPLGIPILLGLGASELSTTPAFVPEAKALVRRLDLARCRTLAAQALGLASAQDIRALARAFTEELE